MKRWRTIPKAAKELRELDPDTPLTEMVIRKLADLGEISVLRSGTWHYVDVNELGGKSEKTH